jgi:hypothetical protein
MANEQRKRLMQEALDSERQHAQRQHLDLDAESTAEFSRLKQVDTLLRTAPFERAPARLALGIMAKLAQAVQQPMTHISGLALALGLALVMLITLPVLIGGLSLFLGAAGSAAALNVLLQQIVNLLASAVAVLDGFVQGAQQVVSEYPVAPALLLSVAPLVLFWLMRVWQKRDSDEGEE